jgi:hypothetical protein
MDFAEILIFLFFTIISIVIKSVKEKKAIEEKKSQNRSNNTKVFDMNPPPKPKTRQAKVKSKSRTNVDDLGGQVKKETKKVVAENASVVTNSAEEKNIKEGYSYKKPDDEVNDKNKPKEMFDIRKDILKGVIYSEILSKPKCFQRKGM